MPVNLFTEAVLTSSLRTEAGDADVLFCKYKAATPATCGDAIEVPEIVFVAVSDVYQADVIEEPGAKMSRQVPKFENDERASVSVVEPTVIAFAARAGE